MFEDKAGTEVGDKQGKTDGGGGTPNKLFGDFFFFFLPRKVRWHWVYFKKLTWQTLESRRMFPWQHHCLPLSQRRSAVLFKNWMKCSESLL